MTVSQRIEDILDNIPAAGASGGMLGEILGRKAGEIAADEVLCLFLLPRPPVLLSVLDLLDSCGVILANALLGVLVALILADLADSVGVL